MSVNPVGWGFELDPGRWVERVVSWVPGKRVVITPSFALEPAHSDAYDGVTAVLGPCGRAMQLHVVGPNLRDVPANGNPPGEKDINHCSPSSVVQVMPPSAVCEFG